MFRTFNATYAIPIWCQVNNGLTSTVVNTLATYGTRVYAGTFLGGIMFLTDWRPAGGLDCRTATAPRWTAPATNVNAIDIMNGFVNDVVIDPNNPATLYAATLGDGTQSIEGNAAEGGVFRSTDSSGQTCPASSHANFYSWIDRPQRKKADEYTHFGTIRRPAR